MKDFNKYFIVGTNSDALHDTMNGTVTGELIRCKDCKHHRGENACEKDGCYGWYDTDYCSRAERRGEE